MPWLIPSGAWNGQCDFQAYLDEYGEKCSFHLTRVANLHGGDLVFDCPNRLVHLLTVNGKDSGLVCLQEEHESIERVVDTRSLVTRLYAV